MNINYNFDASTYDVFQLKKNWNLLFYSNKYWNFLTKFLGDVQLKTIMAYSADNVIGVFPFIIKKDARFGTIINSMPFIGSHGGVVIADNLSNKDEVILALQEEFFRFRKDNAVISSTIINNPYEEINYPASQGGLRFVDSRIGQITFLPSFFPGSGNKIEQRLMDGFDKKLRNLIRKSIRYDIIISHSDSQETYEQLIDLHKTNMQKVGAPAKSQLFFNTFKEVFNYDTDYRVYKAEYEEKIAACLLIAYYGKTVEYFIPAFNYDLHETQALSRLIFEAMKDAAMRGYQVWNWGGTRKELSGVYHFKKQWGAFDKPYNIVTDVMSEELFDFSKSDLSSAFQNFYLAPFTEFKND